MKNKGISNVAMIITVLIIFGVLFFIVPKYLKTKTTSSKKTTKYKRTVPYVGAYKKGTSRAKNIVDQSKDRIKY